MAPELKQSTFSGLKGVPVDEPRFSAFAVVVPLEGEASLFPRREGLIPVDVFGEMWIPNEGNDIGSFPPPDFLVDGETKEASGEPAVVLSNATFPSDGSRQLASLLMEMGEGLAELTNEPGIGEGVLVGGAAEESVGVDQINLIGFDGAISRD